MSNVIGQNQNLLWQLLKTTDKTQFTTSFLTSQPSHINQIETNTTSTKVNITIIFKKSHKTPIYLKSRLIIVYLEVIDKQNKSKLKKRIWKYLEKERRAELRRREGAAKCAATRELWSARIWERGFESEDLRVIFEKWGTPFQRLWERAEMSELCLEMRKGFRTLREGRTTPYRRDKTKNAGAVSERRRLGKKKKKKRSGRRRLRTERVQTVRTVRTGHGSQNRTVGPRAGRFHAFLAWNGSLP